MQISLIPNDEVRTIHCSQYDTELRKWSFTLYANDVFVAPFGTPYLICENGAIVPLTIEGNSLLCDCTEELSSKSGIFNCKIKIEDNNEIIYSQLFQLHCEVKP